MRTSRVIRSLFGVGLAALLPWLASPAAAQYEQVNLVSDIPGRAANTDAPCPGSSAPCLLNPWGVVNPPGGPLWVSDNNAGVSTLYQGNGARVPLVVTIPPPRGGTGPAAPTGVVWNGTRGFVVTKGTASGAAVFIFDTEDGTISGWNPAVDPTHAILAVDNSATGAVYKGLALGSTSAGVFLFATNFRDGVVEMYDSTFHLVKAFTDPTVPPGYAPFGIRNIDGALYVTFALQNAAKHDDVAGPGNGFVDIFDTNGNRITRFVSRGPLNSPWGLALAPADFGKLSNRVLIGNFGDGKINAFDLADGEFNDALEGTDGRALVNDGLWSVWFGDGVALGNPNELFFTAGINGEADGLFGKIVAAPGTNREDDN
jgi:uncharacterized protein (TIGR03118 family)